MEIILDEKPMENYIRLQMIGKNGDKLGCVIDEMILFDELDNTQYPEYLLMLRVNKMREQLKIIEEKYPPKEYKIKTTTP